jgi:thioredoxin reductase (NADPH)
MEAVIEFLKSWAETYGYPVLFGGVLLENAGIPLPGETAVLLAGFLASAAGEHRLRLWLVIVVTVAAAVLGDNLGFWLGRRWARPRLQAGRRFLVLTPRTLRFAEGYFQHFGTWTIFFARFIAGLRIFGALAAGTAGMPWPRFLAANSAGAVTWAVVISLLGYYFGENFGLLHRWLRNGGMIALGVVLVVLVLVFLHGGIGRLLRPPADNSQGSGRSATEDDHTPPAYATSSTGAAALTAPGTTLQSDVVPVAGGRIMPEQVVVIGSGPAGWTAALYAGRANLNPLVFEGAVTPENQIKGTAPLGQLNLTTEVENFPGWPFVDSAVLGQFSKSALPAERYANLRGFYEGKHAHHGRRSSIGPELMEYMRQQAINFGARVITDDIVQVDFKSYPFRLTSLEGKVVEALTVIVATGARANYLGLASEDRFKNNGVSACATCDGALPRFRNQPLVVVGGGDSAVEESMHLSKFASKVYLAHRRDKLRASKIMQKRALENPKIEIKWNRVVEEVLGTDDAGVTAVRLKSTLDGKMEEVGSSGLFLAIGHTPNTDFLRGHVELVEGGYIKWTRPQRTYTSVDGVFAAGDVADNQYRQAVTAAGTGCMAALDAERWLAERGEL